MQKNLCISIAVSKPEGLEEVRGAIPSAGRLAQWASSQGYETELVTDQTEPVSCARLQEVFHRLLGNGGQQRLIVSFAGHGLIRAGAEEFWLLNGWRTKATEAVNHMKLRDRLGTYLPRQLAIISDACRSLPTERARYVEGNGIIDVKDYVEKPVQIVHLSGTRSAQAAYSTPLGAEEAYCFFSQVLVNALHGIPGDGIQHDPRWGRVVTGEKLFDIVERELPLLASRYNRRQLPDLQGMWRTPDHIWSVLPPHPPPDGMLLPVTQPIACMRSHDDLIGSARETSLAPPFSHTRLLPEARFIATGTGLIVHAGHFHQIALPPRSFDSMPVHPYSSVAQLQAAGAWETSPVLLQMSDLTWVGAAVYRDFIGIFGMQDSGAESFILKPFAAPSGSDFTQRQIAKAAAGEPFGAALLETLSSMSKTVDPVLGALAAYACARIGARDDIYRLCSLYASQKQPVPFDVALLARLPVTRDQYGYILSVPAVPGWRSGHKDEAGRAFDTTAPCLARVAGTFPWLRQGWALLEDDFRPQFRALAKYAHRLRPSMFTTLLPAAGQELADQIFRGEW